MLGLDLRCKSQLGCVSVLKFLERGSIPLPASFTDFGSRSQAHPATWVEKRAV